MNMKKSTNTNTDTNRNTNTDTQKLRKNDKPGGVLFLIGMVAFILVFTYLSLNLKNIDFGYDIQKLVNNRKKLREEIDRLKSQKANLSNLKRVEQEVIQKLQYQYPEAAQFIKVFEDKNENK
jgi:cell division protein FtsL